MWGWINEAVNLVAQYPGWALTLAFAAAIIEAVAIFGTFLPGTFILMAIAAAAAAAGQDMMPFLVLAIIGAVIGDFLSYWVGHRYRFTLRQSWPFAQRPYLMDSADRFFRRYGSFSVALCRFIPVLRSTVPLVAGLSGMSRQRFVVANVLSAFVWAPAHVYPASFAGLSIEHMNSGDWHSAALWGGAVVVCCFAGWILHKRLARFAV